MRYVAMTADAKSNVVLLAFTMVIPATSHFSTGCLSQKINPYRITTESYKIPPMTLHFSSNLNVKEALLDYKWG